MSHKKTHSFTMIEILLALGVTAIGICSIMVLFPIGANASRDAAMETYCANTAEELLHYYQYQLQHINNQWDTWIISNGIDDTSNINVDSFRLTPDSDGKPQLTKIKGDNSTENSAWKTTPFTDFPNLTENSTSHIFLLTNIGNNATWSSSTTMADINWAAIIVITKHRININGASVLPNYGISLQADVTWPAQAPKDNRKKVTYVLDIFKNQ